MPTAQGAADGTSWDNAAAFGELDAMIAAVGGDGTVYLRADAGEYVCGELPVVITHGGEDGRPVRIMGVDVSLTPAKAVMVGSRTRWTLPDDPEQVTWVAEWAPGQVILQLALGANHLTFAFLDFRHVGDAFHLTAPLHNSITVEDCSAYNLRRFFEHAAGTSHVGTRLRRVTAVGFSKSAIRVRGNSHDVLLEEVFLNSGRQDGDNWATGVELNQTAHDITMLRVTAMNCHWSAWNNPDDFWNADGFTSELGNYNITRIDCVSSGNTDAGYDDKGERVTNIRCTASDNQTNFKFWGSSHVNEDCQALYPTKRGGTVGYQQYWLSGEGEDLKLPGKAGRLIIRGGLIRDNDPRTRVFVAEGSRAQMRILDVTIERNAGATREYSFGGAGNVFLYGSLADHTPPTITSARRIAVQANTPHAHLLQANKPVTWSVVGGADAEAFSLSLDRDEWVLHIAPFATGSRQAVVQACDASGNTTDQPIVAAVETPH
ncbi:MAG: hypothetical protein ACE149_16805 [Armatimonadota bacterium]